MMIPDYVGMFLTFIMRDRIEEYEQDLAIVKEDYAGLEQDYLNTLEDYGKLLLERVKLQEYNQNLSDQLALVTAQRDNSVDTIMKLTGDNVELANKLKAANHRKAELREGLRRFKALANQYSECCEGAEP